MKLWEILKENNINKYVCMINRKDFDYEENREYYIVSKNRKGKIGLFTCDGWQDNFLPSDIIEMEFEFIEKKEIKPKYKIGEKIRSSKYIKTIGNTYISGVYVSDEHSKIARNKEKCYMTIKDIKESWLYEPIYIVKENDLM